MNERDPLAVLTELVAPFDDDSNAWEDVLRRAHARMPTTRELHGTNEPPLAPAPTASTAHAPERHRRRSARPDRWQLRTAVGLIAVAAVVATPPGRAGAEWVGHTLGLVELGDSPTRHELVIPGDPRQSYVIATGHAPEGGRFELVLDRYPEKARIADGEEVDRCLTLEWPDTGRSSAHSFCGPGFPPPQAGGRAPGGVPARPFGYLSPIPGAPNSLALYGFTDPQVKRVDVTYPTAGGMREKATVDLIEPSDALHRRIRSITPVNVFVAFLPSSAGADLKGSSKTLEVIAYDADGHELGRVRHDNLTNPSVRGG